MVADTVFGTLGLLEKVAEYCSAEDISSHCGVSRRFREAFGRDCLWQELCTTYGFRSLTSVTKTRGRKSFKSIYIDALCIECRSAEGSAGSIVIDTNGGSSSRMGGIDGPKSSLVCLCAQCFQTVQECGQWSDRIRFSLQNAKKRLTYHVWSTVLNKIPYKNTDKKRKVAGGTSAVAGTGVSRGKKSSERYEDPESNNYLLKLLKK
mgnify:CR=1 FL=1